MHQIIVIDGESIIIDEEDLHLLQHGSWRIQRVKKAKYLRWKTTVDGAVKGYLFHRLVMNAKDGTIVDHINRNSLDNRKSNLRFVTRTQNATNSTKRTERCGVPTTSRFYGVCFVKNKNRWRSTIRYGGRERYIGTFKDECAAAHAYDLASIKHHGEYGTRNFLPLVF